MSAPLYPTPTRLKAFGEVQRAEIRWHHFVTPEARNIVTDRVRTAVLREMSAAGIVDIGSAEPGNYSVPTATEFGHVWAAGGDELDAWLARANAALVDDIAAQIDSGAMLQAIKDAGAGPDSTSPEPGPDGGSA